MGITNNTEYFKKVYSRLAEHELTGKWSEKPAKFLGICYHYYDNGAVKLHQRPNAEQFLATTGMTNCKPISTPLDANVPPLEEMPPEEPTDLHTYQKITGEAIWLTQTRYDIAFAVNRLTRKMSKPDAGDLRSSKRLARHIADLPDRGLTFNHGNGRDAQTYTYVDGGMRHRSITGTATFIGVPDLVHHINDNAAVSCLVKSESKSVTSSMHSELIAIFRGTITSEYIADARDETGFPQTSPSIIFTDNQPAIRFLEQTGKIQSRTTRHLRRRTEYVRQAIASGRIKLMYVPSHLNCADVLTKALPKDLFLRHTKNLMGRLVKCP